MRFLRCLALVLATIPASLAAQNPPGVAQTPAGYTVDFNNQDIRIVLTALAEAGGINVTFGDLPEIQTTLHLGQPVPKEKLLDVMRGVIEQSGLTMTTDSSLVRIGRARRQGENLGVEERLKVDLYTYRLKHAGAAQIAPLLMNLFTGASLGNGGPVGGGNGGSGNSNQSRGATPTLPLRTGDSLLVGGGNDQQLQNPGVPVTPQLVQQQPPSGDQGAGGGQGQRRRGGRRAADALSQVRVVAEESTNTLLIRATPQEWEWIQKILQDVDLRPLQALIEAVIVEVTRTKDLNVGVDATARYKGVDADLPAAPNARDFLLQLTGNGTIDFTAALNALATRGNLRVRSLPIIIAQNNKQALLNVGSARPFVQVLQSSGLDPTGRIQTIQYLDVGTKLQITPRINADGYVNLEVAQTANNATTETQFDAPVLSKREATTQVFLRDGQTTVLGGLADNTREDTQSGIPVLRDFPLIGGLFGSTHRSDVQTELYVFLTPHIISEDADIDRLRNSLHQQSQALQKDPVMPLFSSPSPAPAPSPMPVPPPSPTP